MYKQSPSRNHRSKGIKAKHVLQICLLLAVCFWLIYQVKHSQEKKREFNAKDEKVVDKLQKDSEIVRFGRKDLPRVSEIATDGDKHAEDDEEKEAEEEDDNKRDEDEPEKDDEKGGGDDETDENVDELKEAEQVDEDSEEDVDENHVENEEKEFLGKDDRFESGENEEVGKNEHDERDASSNGQGHGIDNADKHEEREEPYKADDASSEVANHVQNIIPETENVTKAHANSIFGNGSFVQENEAKSSNNPNASTNTDVRSTDNPKERPSLSNGTQKAFNANVSLNADTVNTTVGKDPNLLGNVLGDNSKPELATGNPNKTENAHINVEKSLGSSGMAADSKKADDTDATGAENDSSVSDGARDDKLEKNGTGEGIVRNDPIDESDTNLTDEEKETRTDLKTLPDISTKARNTEEVMML
ncbi:hypothetical protein RND81_14G193400 [Saponaria officinalis]|uniref:Uncharacterized protein n=1 Tax=Saponaria officinalis TaxID=3572 RepID=A0AAW1GP70_SAPOF